ncbi:MAG: bifunctional D-glycero-beta-D-manno-heptose-7-phosphate kinase/D-glycero-beta-D-manno-heptose 1-phosphate adenylyltransferase HldE [Gammaproteobacteria bacterium]|nr:bifunctional D-glycero-beta-D-manno-heptose-7-phosphate kinase/D-glycero-beta-D-manno-heptose 1-phosphate adenylyltransferase HldE [Gammaproteobacteria bacterium]
MTIPEFNGIHVLVVGDLMLDRYYSGQTNRMSPEAPVPIVKVETMQSRAGGAGNVALNIRELEGKVTVLGYLGNDSHGDELLDQLKLAGIDCLVERTEDARTITKLRILSRHQQLIRLDFEDSFINLDKQGLFNRYSSILNEVDVVVLSDYGKGTLSDCNQFIAEARNAGVKVLIDPKGTDFSRYRNATMLTPNLQEFEAVAGQCSSQQDLEHKGQGLVSELNLDALLVTQGEMGMTLFVNQHKPVHFNTEAREVYDVTGAGDTVIAMLASSIAAGLGFAEATELANTAAGIVVGKLGAATVSREEVSRFRNGNKSGKVIMNSITELLAQVAQARQTGQTIAVTNGCFDILHPGHLRYLEQAADLADHLIVLVNNDDSIHRLKGEHRPVNPLAFRMEMLAAMKPVKWILPFDGDTPEPEISEIKPNLLIKGGDYDDVTQIAGYRQVIENGGDVRVLPFIDGYSTTSLISKIRHSQH